MHDGFEFWLDGDAGEDPNVKASLERANASIYPDRAAGRGARRVLVPGAGEGARALGAAGRGGPRRWTRWPG